MVRVYCHPAEGGIYSKSMTAQILPAAGCIF